MSGAENEAVEAAARVMAARAGFDLDDLQRHARPGEDVAAWRANWITSAREVYDAMRPVIAREVIAGVCEREGHREVETTTFADGHIRQFACARCGAKRSEPRDKWADALNTPRHVGHGSLPIKVCADGATWRPGWLEIIADGPLMGWTVEMRAAPNSQLLGQLIPIQLQRGGATFQAKAVVSAWRVDSDDVRTILAGSGEIAQVDGGDRAQG